jgi:hypothetical protein
LRVPARGCILTRVRRRGLFVCSSWSLFVLI